MLAKRIVPCLDVKDGRTVKGVNFVDLIDAGDPVELGKVYSDQGADELVFLDITATHEERKTVKEMVRRVAANINIPFTIGGGIGSIKDAAEMLDNGADKVSVNSAAVKNPQLVENLAREFGSQFVVVAIDAKNVGEDWIVHVSGGRKPTDRFLFEWAQLVADMGAGEILFTSMNHDGTKGGFANDALAKLSDMLPIPIIASGGAGEMQHFKDTFVKGKADAALAASVFHFHEIDIPDLKQYLHNEGITVRLD
ncbi:MAG: imidazole glycerol phosphate synthase subunit HisF [Bacteroidia bacterium]|nr:imidazole glycerol phosphate synthase subunit HisF [Bacteroidia bacterium]